MSRINTNNLRHLDATVDNISLDSNGRVGIGITSPGAALEVAQTTDMAVIAGTSGTSNAARLEARSGNGTTSGKYAYIRFNNNDTNNQRYDVGTYGTDDLTFRDVKAGSTRMTLDTSGRLLVGASTSMTTGAQARYAKLQVVGSTASAAGQGIISIGRGQSASNITANNDIGYINFTDNTGGEFAQIGCLVDGTCGTNDYPGILVFSTTADGASSLTERMRIKENGQVLISGSTTTSAVYAFQANDSGGNALFALRNDGYINTGSRAVSPYNNTTASAANMYVLSDGGLYRSTSSIRFKTDVETLQPQYADALLNCRPVWYRSLCANDNKDWGYWGFIAEEVAEIDPRLVFWKTHETENDEDGNTVQVELKEPIAEGVQYDRFVPHLLNLIKRQGEAIAELQAEVAALKGA